MYTQLITPYIYLKAAWVSAPVIAQQALVCSTQHRKHVEVSFLLHSMEPWDELQAGKAMAD